MLSRKLLLVAGALALAIPAVAWKLFGGDDPTPAVLGIAAGELVLVIGMFAAKAAAATANRRMTQLAEAVDRALSHRMSRYGARYRQWVLDSRRFIDARGLATVGDFTPELDEIFVDVGLAPRAPHQVTTGILSDVPADGTRRHSIWDFIDKPDPVVLAVIGAPGSGKTTLLSHVARQVAQSPKAHQRTIPVLLQLRDHATQITADPKISLPNLLRGTVPALRTPEPAGWWETQLEHGRCVVLLDGLDEVASSDDRRDTTAWINRQISIYPRADYVVTSRPHGYRAAVVDSARTLQVRPFTVEQVARFLRGWYLAVERRANGPGRDVDLRAQDAANDLLDRLAATPALYDLTINPLLLTMIANVHRYRGSLPGSRADLYSEVCQVMLWRRQEAKRLVLELPGTSKERLLARLAFQMMRQRAHYVPRQQVLDTVRNPLKRMSSNVTPDQFLADVGSNGLLVEHEKDVYAFAHLTFQEYLAAKHIRDHNLRAVLVDAVDDSWWRETTLLYVAGADADPITRAALASGTTNALSLAFECTELGAELAPDLRDQLQQVLATAFRKSADPEHRRLVAGVLANQHLRYLVPVSTGSVCPRPITSQLYWLFLQETNHPRPDSPCSAIATSPASGLWAGDPRAFLTWLNAIATENGEALHRLPTRAELTELAAKPGPAATVLNSSVPSAWTMPRASDTPELWTLDGRWVPNTVTGAEVLRALAQDVRRSSIVPALVPQAAQAIAFALGVNGARVLGQAIRLSGMVASARNLRIELVSARGMRPARELAHDVRRAVARDTSLALALDRTLALGPALDRDTLFEIEQALADYRDGEIANDLGRALSLDRDIAIAMEWHQDLGLGDTIGSLGALHDALRRSRSRVRTMAAAADARRRAAPASPLPCRQLSAGDGGIELDLDAACALVMGRACQRALTAALQPSAEASVLDGARFTRAFAAAARLSEDGQFAVALDALGLSIRSAAKAVGAMRDGPGAAWAGAAATELVRMAEPVFARRRSLDADVATRIRLHALALAAEGGGAEQFRTVAAGVTLLQLRVTRQHDLETLVLARA